MKTILSLFMSLLCATCNAQSLYEAIRDPNASGISGYIFVSTRLPDTTLIALAGDARRAGVSMVLNGYVNDGPRGLEDTKRKVAEINAACCSKGGAHWQINPLLYQRYKIRATPAFVIGKGTSNKPEDFSKVSGEMSLGNALKFFAQNSQISDIKKRANEVYLKAFAER